MAFFPSLAAGGGLKEIQAPFREMYLHWGRFSQALMRGDGPLTIAERELIAAFVSGLNACTYCFHDHAMAAREFGIDAAVFGRLIDDLDAAPIEERMKPLLCYARTLTQAPARLTQADADAVFAAGWSESALHMAIMVAARFNCINRLVMGHGIAYSPHLSDVWKNEQGLSYLILEDGKRG